MLHILLLIELVQSKAEDVINNIYITIFIKFYFEFLIGALQISLLASIKIEGIHFEQFNFSCWVHCGLNSTNESVNGSSSGNL